VRSGRRQSPAAPAAAAALAAAGVLASCSTTQQEAARLQLNSARIRAAEQPTRVTVPGAAVRVTSVALVAAGGRTAFVVDVRNRSGRGLSDLPVSVGLRIRAGRRVYLNARSTLEYSYFDAHLPMVPPHGTLTWVYTTDRRLPPHATPFAAVGAEPAPPVPGSSTPPLIRARALVAPDAPTTGGHRGGGTPELAIALQNRSGVPQYQLQVYAFAQRAGHYVAAGNRTILYLGGQASTTLRLGLLGSLDHARLRIEALPTILQ
jgi:hypothetical protein